MSNEAKNLDELFYFAQTLLKEVQEKKKELKLKNNEKSNSVMNLSSLKEKREKAIRYRTWRQRFCDISSHNTLARSMDRLVDLENKWNTQKKEQYFNPNLSASFCNTLIPTQEGVRNSRWDLDSNNNSKDLLDRHLTEKDSNQDLIRSSFKPSARALSQGCVQTKLILDENIGDQLEKNPSHKINFLNTIKNFTPSKNDTTSEKDTSMMDTPSSKIEPSVNSQQETPKETTTNKRTQISPFRREFLRRNFIETQQKTIQIKAPDQTIDNLTPLSVCTPQQSKLSVTMPAKTKSSSRNDSVNLFDEPNKEGQRGRPASSSRENNLSKKFKDKLQPVSGSSYNSNDQAKHTPKTKEGNVQVKVKFSNKGKILETILVQSNTEKKPNAKIVALKNLFIAESRPTMKSTSNDVVSPRRSSQGGRTSISQIWQEGKSKDSESTRNENDSSTFASITSSQIKVKNEIDQDIETNKFPKDSLNRNIRSSSCNTRKNTSVRGREPSHSPYSGRNKFITSNNVSQENIQKLKKEKRTPSKQKVKKDLKLGKSTNETAKKEKDVKNNALKFDREKIVNDMLAKLQAKKPKQNTKNK